MIAFDQTTKRERDGIVPVIRGASLVVRAGECHCILAGHPGERAVLVDLLTGAARPDSGHVLRQGRVSFPVGSGRMFDRRLSARDNLAWLAGLHGADRRALLDFLEAQIGRHLLRRPLSALPGAERSALQYFMSYALPFETYVAADRLLPPRGSGSVPVEPLLRERCRSSAVVLVTGKPRTARDYVTSLSVLSAGVLLQAADLPGAVAALGSVEPDPDDTPGVPDDYGEEDDPLEDGGRRGDI